MQKFSKGLFVAMAFALVFSFTSCEKDDPAKDKYSVIVTITPEKSGTIEGSGAFYPGDEVKLTAIPSQGFKFIGWSDSSEELSEELVYSFIMPEKDLNITAAFDVHSETITFQSINLQPESYWNGSDGSGPMIFGMATFSNEYNSDWGSWSGFAFSNTTDIETPGLANQFSAYISAGGDAENTYAVSYAFGDAASITFSSEVNLLSADFTNSTYAYLSMLNGDANAKKFEAGDWFELTVVGFDAAGEQVDEVTYRLADYTSGTEFITEKWTEVDLRPLKGVTKLVFNLESTDVGEWGMNTPAYFCMDNLKFQYFE